MSRSWLNAKDSKGNLHPNWQVETWRDRRRLALLIEMFNIAFKNGCAIPDLKLDGLPLPPDTEGYLTHNEVGYLDFTERVNYFGRRHSCENCHISLAWMTVMKTPILTSNAQARTLYVVLPDCEDKTKYAIYRMNMPTLLWSSAYRMDHYDITKDFDKWDKREPIHSKCPSYGYARDIPAGGNSGWAQIKSSKERDRPTIQELSKLLGVKRV